jgi:hypothetical protein
MVKIWQPRLLFYSHHKQCERQTEALNTFPIKINATKNNNSLHGKSKAKKWPIKKKVIKRYPCHYMKG